MSTSKPLPKLCELNPGDETECFGLLCAKENQQTRDGKPYFRVQFRDLERTVTVMVWSDASLFEDCNTHWKKGEFYRLNGTYLENNYGPQFKLVSIRGVNENDTNDGFQPGDFFISSSFDTQSQFQKLQGISEDSINNPQLKLLVQSILETFKEEILVFPAASRNHHAWMGGYLEHVLSVTMNANLLANKYREMYPDIITSDTFDLIIAGAILHDIGKVFELDGAPQGADYTKAGRLIGHIVLGRDIVKEQAAKIPDFDQELLLRLEHVILAHQGQPDWGSPVYPTTPEALIVHYADDVDAKFMIMCQAIRQHQDSTSEFTDRNNALKRMFFKES